MTKVVKIWPFLTGPSKYHDHHLGSVMKDDNIDTLFYAPKYTDPLFRGSGLTEDTHTCFSSSNLFKFWLFFGKTMPRKPYKLAKEVIRNADIIHFFGLAQPSALLLLVLIRLLGYKNPVYFNEHTDLSVLTKPHIIYHRLLVILYSVFIKNCHVICCDEKTKIYWQKRGLKAEISVINLGYNEDDFYVTDAERLWPKLRIGFAGRVDERKNLETLLDKAQEFPDIDFYICGFNDSKYSKDLLDTITKSSCLNNVVCQDFAKGSEVLRNFYNKIDVAIYPGSITIGTFEANACGCPVLINRWDEDYSDRIRNSRGFSFENGYELSNLISMYQELKRKECMDPMQILRSTQSFTWQSIKYSYYEKYKLNVNENY